MKIATWIGAEVLDASMCISEKNSTASNSINVDRKHSEIQDIIQQSAALFDFT